MRKHPLIAVTAIAALGASVAAGASTGTFNSVLTSAQAKPSTGPPGVQRDIIPKLVGSSRLDRSTRLDHLTRLDADWRTALRGGATLVVAHDPHRWQDLRVSSKSGLPVLPKPKPAHKRPPAPPPPPPPVTTLPPPAPTTTTTTLPPVSATAPAGGVWYELRMCESSDNYAENSGNGYYGAYQFSLSTWYGLGFGGLPSDAPPAVQDQAAQELQARSGWGQWPACSAALGL